MIMHQLHVKWVRGEPMTIENFVIDTINDSNDDDDNEYQLYSQRYLQYTMSNSQVSLAVLNVKVPGAHY